MHETTHSKIKIAIIIFLISFLLFIAYCIKEFYKDFKAKEYRISQMDARFEFVEEFRLTNDQTNTVKIYRDKTTGLEYIYSWMGSSQAGPVLTRYYRK